MTTSTLTGYLQGCWQNPPVLVLVTGSRDWSDEAVIHDRLARFPPGKTGVLHGGARGVDQIAHKLARQLGFQVVVVTPDWATYGRKAGIMRNLEMLDLKPDLVLGFWNGTSRGTKHCLEEARRRGIPTEITTLP